MSDHDSTRRAGRVVEQKPQAEVDDELQFHLERRIADYVARGMTPEAARAAALERLGDLDGVRRDCTHLLEQERRLTHRRDWLGDLRQDLAFGLRSALRAPLFSLLAIVTLALGIGANAAVFGVVKSVLLDALPYRDADRVVRLYGSFASVGTERGPLSIGTLRDARERARSYESMAVFETMARESVLDGLGAPRVVKAHWAEPGLFRTLGVTAAMGRVSREDDTVGDTVYHVVVTHAAWQRLFGGDPQVVGSTTRVNGIPRTIVGVLPREFSGPVGEVDFYFPMSMGPYLRAPERLYMRQNWNAVARLAPGATVESARKEMDEIAAGIAREQPSTNTAAGIATVAIREAMAGDTRTPLLVLMASAALVLMITCANLAGALLSRTLTRRKEFAVRAALGAGRWRLVRQLLAESTVLAVAGGAAGVLLAVLGLRAARRLAASALPPYAELALDGGVLAVTGITALLTGIAFGLAPALSVSRANMQGMLREESRGSSESRRSRHLRGALVAGQIALCVSLLAGAGLLTRSLIALTQSPLGFRPDGLLAATVQLPPGRFNQGEARWQFIEQFSERLRALPGVTHVAATADIPTRGMSRNGVTGEGAPVPASGEGQTFALYHTVSDDFFRTMQIPLVAGRVFGPEDAIDGPPVLVISRQLAQRFWPDQDAVGRRIRFGPNDDAPWMTVVGVVGDVANDPAKLEPEIATYMSLRQAPWNGPIFLLRTNGDPRSLVRLVGAALAEHDATLPLKEAAPMTGLIAEGLSGRRLPVLLMTGFGVLALLLASVGVYAMFAAMAGAREREFGVRMALGARPSGIAALVLRQGGAWMLAGLAGGALGIALMVPLLRGLLYGVRPFDPVSLGAAVLALLVCGTVALLVPVRRATRVDPITVLR
jgi:putative ABC transport system permease protein